MADSTGESTGEGTADSTGESTGEGTADSTGESTAPAFSVQACEVPGLEAPAGRVRTCGTLAVPQARLVELPAAAQATVPVYVEHFERAGAEVAPIVFLTGGPGVSLDAYARLSVLQKVLDATERPVILIEQRGNARSASGLDCPGATSPQECADALRADGIIPEAFNSRESAADVADVIEALGYDRAVLWGHSYGSGLAQRVAARFPESVDALVLEGVAHPTERLPHDPVAHRLEMLEAFGTWFDSRCALDPGCAASYPDGIDPRGSSEALLGVLTADPELAIPITEGVALNLDLLFGWALNGLAFHEGMLMFSLMADAAAASGPEDRTPLDAFRSYVGDGDPARGAARFDAMVQSLLSLDAGVSLSGPAKYCFDNDLFGVPGNEECDALDPTIYDEAEFEFSLTTDRPTLFLQGALDTQTPIAEADTVRDQFSRLTDVTFAACVGHFSFRDTGTCGPQVVQAFLDEPNAPAIPGCVDSVCDAQPLVPGPL